MGQRLNPFGVLQVVHLVRQDLSIAGKRAGLAGARSGLFMEQVRIVKEMREADKRNGRTGNMVRPRYLVWENVCGAYSSNGGRDFHAVLEEIARIAEPGFSLSGLPEKWKWTKSGAIDGDGWSIAWRTHDTKDWGKTIRDSRTGNVIRLGTPQRRRRISVVADFGGESAAQIQFDRESVSGHPAESGAAGEGSAEAAESGFNPAVARSLTARADGSPYNAKLTGDVAASMTSAMAKGGSNTGPTVMCLNDQGGSMMGVSHDVSGTLRAQEHGHQPAVAYSFDSLSSNSMKSKNPHSGCREVDVAKTLDTTDPTPSKNQGGIAVVAPAVALDMTHACDVIRECGEQVPALQARMGTGGNQVPLTYQDVTGTLSPGAHAGSYNGQDAYNDMLVCGASTDVAHALRAKANCAYREDAETYLVQNMVVRRLTPLECTRLQGYPDGWVDIGDWTDEKGKKHKDADSPKYKALGNSIALPFWDWMLRRMARYLPEDATLGSLFDGIGGFPLVFERIHGKGTARWASEIEPFPIAVTKKWFGEE